MTMHEHWYGKTKGQNMGTTIPRQPKGVREHQKRLTCMVFTHDLVISIPKSWRDKNEISLFLSVQFTEALRVEIWETEN